MVRPAPQRKVCAMFKSVQVSRKGAYIFSVSAHLPRKGCFVKKQGTVLMTMTVVCTDSSPVLVFCFPPVQVLAQRERLCTPFWEAKGEVVERVRISHRLSCGQPVVACYMVRQVARHKFWTRQTPASKYFPSSAAIPLPAEGLARIDGDDDRHRPDSQLQRS